ncbi:hypothetical protein ECDEC14A_1558 [Escherichia coli DEC14A]|nr:hypothetical protein ECDEC14A_1558 [Escherichia coli DEC14A]
MTAAAPSLMEEAFPAVTLPAPGRKAGFSCASFSSCVPERGCSSVFTQRGGFYLVVRSPE